MLLPFEQSSYNFIKLKYELTKIYVEEIVLPRKKSISYMPLVNLNNYTTFPKFISSFKTVDHDTHHEWIVASNLENYDIFYHIAALLSLIIPQPTINDIFTFFLTHQLPLHDEDPEIVYITLKGNTIKNLKELLKNRQKEVFYQFTKPLKKELERTIGKIEAKKEYPSLYKETKFKNKHNENKDFFDLFTTQLMNCTTKPKVHQNILVHFMFPDYEEILHSLFQLETKQYRNPCSSGLPMDEFSNKLQIGINKLKLTPQEHKQIKELNSIILNLVIKPSK